LLYDIITTVFTNLHKDNVEKYFFRQRIMKVFKNLKKYLITYFSLIVIFVLLLSLSNLIPKDRIINNVQASSKQLLEYKNISETSPDMAAAYKIDYYTDSVMINTAYFTDTKNPINSALACSSFGGGVDHLINVASKPSINPNKNYSRYWHGYLIFLRPLLMFFDYLEIGILNTYLFFVLLCICLVVLAKKVSGWFPIAFILTIASLNIIILPINMQLACVFLMSFLSILFVLYIYNKRRSYTYLAFFIIGMITMFFDFYTYPILTYGFPAIALVALIDKEGNMSLKGIFKLVFLCLLTWGLGYVLAWIGKIILAGVFVGKSEIEAAFVSWSSRIAREVPDLTKEKVAEGINSLIPSLNVDRIPLWIIAICISAFQVINRASLTIASIILVLFLVLFILFRKKKGKRKVSVVYIAVAAIPLLWFSVAANPTIIHFYFQYRGIGVTILALLCAMFSSIDTDKLKERISRSRSKKKKTTD